MNFPIRQQVSGCIFPKVVNGPAATSLALQYQLRQSQFWPEEKMQKFQFSQLSVLLSHAYKTVPFYKKKFDEIGFVPQEIVDEYTFSNLPIISREEVQSNSAELISNNVPHSHGRTNKVRTSGSTGRPLEILSTELAVLMWRAFNLREHYWFNRDLKKNQAAIRYAPFGTADNINNSVYSKGWGPSIDTAFECGNAILLNSNVDIRQQAEWLIKHNPEYLMSHPSNIMALAEYFSRTNLRIPNLIEIRSHGEPVTERLRDVVLNVWQVPIVDIYSTVELGYLALQCPEHNHYHVQSEGVILEVLDDDDKPCKPGEIGRVIATPLHNFASPLIRYEVGDYAQVGDECSCGRKLPVIKQVLGRVRNMVQLPGGGQAWPEFGFADFADIKQIKQVQLIQHSYDLIEAKIVADGQITSEHESRLVNLWRRNFRHAFNIKFSYVDEILRGPRGKFEDFMCLLNK